MRFFQTILLLSTLILTGCKEDFNPITDLVSLEQYYPNNQEAVPPNKDYSEVYVINSKHSLAGRENSLIHKASVWGYMTNSARERVDTDSLVINGLSIPHVRNLEEEVQRDLFHEGYSHHREWSDDFEQLLELYRGQPVEIAVAAPELGHLREQIYSPSLTGVSLGENEFAGPRRNSIIYGKEGIKITWDAPQPQEKALFPPDEIMQVGILLQYDAVRTASRYPGSSLPTENKTWSVITPNDGEYTIDFSEIEDFPSGGLHVLTIANGMTFTFEFDGSNNSIRVHNGNIVRTEFTLVGCPHDPDARVCDCATVGC